MSVAACSSGPGAAPVSATRRAVTTPGAEGPAPKPEPSARPDRPEARTARPAGTVYPLTTLDNKPTRLAAYRGKVTLVAMWASYCAPCLDEMTYIQAIADKYRGNPKVRVIAVSIDDNDAETRAKIKQLVAKHKLTLPMLIDSTGALMKKLAPQDKYGKRRTVVPLMVVIDEMFRLRRKWGLDHQLPKVAFVDEVAQLIEPALRGEVPAAAKPYEAPMGSFFSRKLLTIEATNLSEAEVDAYRKQIIARIRRIQPKLRPKQLASLRAELTTKLRRGGTFAILVPEP